MVKQTKHHHHHHPPAVNYAPKGTGPVITRIRASDCSLEVQWSLPLYAVYSSGMIQIACKNGLENPIELSAEEVYAESFVIDGLENGVEYAISITVVQSVDAVLDGDAEAPEWATAAEDKEGKTYTSATVTAAPVGLPSALTAIAYELSSTASGKVDIDIKVQFGDNGGDNLDELVIVYADITDPDSPTISQQKYADITEDDIDNGVTVTLANLSMNHTYSIYAYVTNLAGASLPSDKLLVDAKIGVPSQPVLVSMETCLHDDDGDYAMATLKSTSDKPKSHPVLLTARMKFAESIEKLEKLLEDAEELGAEIALERVTGKVGTFTARIEEFEDYDGTVWVAAIQTMSDSGCKSKWSKPFDIVFGHFDASSLGLALLPSADESEAVANFYKLLSAARLDIENLVEFARVTLNANGVFGREAALESNVLRQKLTTKLVTFLRAAYNWVVKLKALFSNGMIPGLMDEAIDFSGEMPEAASQLAVFLSNVDTDTTFEDLLAEESMLNFVRVLAVLHDTLPTLSADQSLAVVLIDNANGTGVMSGHIECLLTIKDSDGKKYLDNTDVSGIAALAFPIKVLAGSVLKAILTRTASFEDSDMDSTLITPLCKIKKEKSTGKYPLAVFESPTSTATVAVPLRVKPVSELSVYSLDSAIALTFSPETNADHYEICLYDVDPTSVSRINTLKKNLKGGAYLKPAFTPIAKFYTNIDDVETMANGVEYTVSGPADSSSVLITWLSLAAELVDPTFARECAYPTPAQSFPNGLTITLFDENHPISAPTGNIWVGIRSASDLHDMSAEVFSGAIKIGDYEAAGVTDASAKILDAKAGTVELCWTGPTENAVDAADDSNLTITGFTVSDLKGKELATVLLDSESEEYKVTVTLKNLKAGETQTLYVRTNAYYLADAEGSEKVTANSAPIPLPIKVASKPLIEVPVVTENADGTTTVEITIDQSGDELLGGYALAFPSDHSEDKMPPIFAGEGPGIIQPFGGAEYVVSGQKVTFTLEYAYGIFSANGEYAINVFVANSAGIGFYSATKAVAAFLSSEDLEVM